MSTITLPRADVTSDEVAQALRNGLGQEYHVLPGMRMTQYPWGKPRPDQPDTIMVGTQGDRLWRAQVTLIRRSGQTTIRITAGGIFSDRIANTFGIARAIRRVLSEDPGLGASA